MKFLKWLLIILAVLGLLFFFVLGPYMRDQTKKHSPEKTSTYEQNGFDLTVNYSSPSKKDRVIFGELVPYNTVWRTGANEPTTFITTSDIEIGDQNLPAGTYSLWTKPNKENWLVIFNEDIPDWGVTILSGGKETTRSPENDVVEIEVPVEETNQTIENLTIDFENEGQLYLFLSWDRTKVKVPINK
ncbi:MAG: DUF2911 domain-containing protein [Pricia sp.]|nr:DUF2911 domain-containing protein [Pricia sp.]